MDDRSWMYRRVNNGGITNEFKQGVVEFLNKAFRSPRVTRYGDAIACPCKKCCFRWFKTRKHVNLDLLQHGFVENYLVWDKHGEGGTTTAVHSSRNNDEYPQHNWARDMVMDVAGPSLEDDEEVAEEPTGFARDFYDLLDDSDEPLWTGCTKHSKLSAITLLLHAKIQYRISNEGFDHLISLISEMLPEDSRLPTSTYQMKSVIKKLGMSYEKIHACLNDCILFRGEYASFDTCPVCNESRYKRHDKENKKKKPIPHKILRYFPLIPRLQRLYMSPKTAEHMRWHKEKRLEVGDEMRHPADAEEWKQFDIRFPSFASDERNVRLSLSSDGFNPFGVSSISYSCWPVFVIPTNLPPGMCMKGPYMYMSLLIPGPKGPRRSIDVYLRPLIEELQLLWSEGVRTYDAYKKQHFQMHAALLMTISDFPAYGMLSGWSTHGRLACPCCMSNDLAFRLKNCGKPSFFGCHRRWLPPSNKWRSYSFASKFNGVAERRVAPQRKSGATILSILNRMGPITFGQMNNEDKWAGYGVEHNWTKKSVFFELPYWSTLLVRHHLDVMHIEKNVFENIFNTIMNVKGKSKDHLGARKDMKEMGIRSELHPIPQRGNSIMPKAVYSLKKEASKQVYEWLKSLKVPDGFSANISRSVNLDEYKLQGLKSHDCHVFLEKYLPLAFRDMLPKEVWEPLAELSNFFQCLCSKMCRRSDLDKLQRQIIKTLCKLEMIFPPSFFDSMEHIIIHLTEEVKVGGPVQYRWMFPIEREIFDLKKKVRNKARPDGSIAEAYLTEELTTFCSRYFDTKVKTKLTRPDRQFEGVIERKDSDLSIFVQHGCTIGKCDDHWLKDDEYNAAALFVLMNCEEVTPYSREFQEGLVTHTPDISLVEYNRRIKSEFVEWFKNRVEADTTIVNAKLRELSRKPSRRCARYEGCLVNGYRFWTKARDENKTTQNSGVYVKGGWKDQIDETVYYGHLQNVYQVEYPGFDCINKVILFKCEWYDINEGVVVDKKFGIVDVNLQSRLKNVYDPFIFATQANQCFYAPQVGKKRKGWSVVIHTTARHFFEVPIQNEIVQDVNVGLTTEAFQEDDVFIVENEDGVEVQVLNDEIDVLNEDDVWVDDSTINMDFNYNSEDEYYEESVHSDDNNDGGYNESDSDN